MEFISFLLFPLFASNLTFYLFCKSKCGFLAFLHSVGGAVCQACHGTFLQESEKMAHARNIFFGDTVGVFVDGSCVRKWGPWSKKFE